jgi:hypothetical protein
VKAARADESLTDQTAGPSRLTILLIACLLLIAEELQAG